MITIIDVQEIIHCVEGSRRIGDRSPEQKIRKILERIYDDGYEDGRKENE